MQLDLKTTGWGPAGNPTRRRTQLFADWIEVQAMLAGEKILLPQPELVDRLEGTPLIKDHDDAWNLVSDAFHSIRDRKRSIGPGYPFDIPEGGLTYVDASPLPYTFCLLASLPEQLRSLRTLYPVAFRDIFEKLVVEAMRASFSGWDVHPTGWSSIANDAGKGAVVGKVALWALAKSWDKSVFPNANDAQVDIAAVRPFGDDRAAFPVILGQCATGVTDWMSKANRPNLERWMKAVQFPHTPTRLFAVPFALDESTFWEATVECSGLVLDRIRLCKYLGAASAELQGEITEWLGQATSTLPAAA